MSHHHPDIPQVQARNNVTISDIKFLVPSPVPTRRNRTFSASERAATGPSYKGKIKSFCRQRGHGFITPEESEEIFVHISDIEGEYVPCEGDEVTYKTVAMPPKTDRYQAVHVVITHLAPGVTHERWEAPVSPLSSSPKIPH